MGELQNLLCSKECQTLLNNIPGGVQQCLNDEAYTMVAVNQGFLDMFGFSREEIAERFGDHFIEMVHPSDRKELLEMASAQFCTSSRIMLNYRVICKDGSYKWVIDHGQLVRDESGEERIFCVIMDDTEARNAQDDLRRRAERDALTGLYNREETERQIHRHLACEPDESCALFMIDTDNFKLVNDSQGHLFGDAVLSELAAIMKKLTRQTDVVGRIGGDEFMVFLKDIPSVRAAAKKAEELLELFRHLFNDEKQLLEITCSIGVAVYPRDGKDFQSLYHSADQALYQAKNQGKNQYVIFDPNNTVPVDRVGYSSLGAVSDSDQREVGGANDLVGYVFQILYDSSDIENAVQMILEIVGKRFDVSRAYVFENSEDGRFTDNTYEWCDEGIEPEKDNLQHFPYSSLEGYEELFIDDSIFYCRDIYALKPKQIKLFESQGIRSTLQCAIREQGKFCGFVGFDECTGKRLWTREEVGMLSLIAQVLTTFLQVKRVTDRDRHMAVQLNTILDVQDAYIYVVKKDTYELLYINRKTKTLDPQVRAGMACYRAFFESSKPCRDCLLSKGGGEIYNPKYERWTKIRVAPMKWDTQDAYLLTCFDITEYKRMQNTQ